MLKNKIVYPSPMTFMWMASFILLFISLGLLWLSIHLADVNHYSKFDDKGFRVMTIDQTICLGLAIACSIYWIVSSFLAFFVEGFKFFSKNKL